MESKIAVTTLPKPELGMKLFWGLLAIYAIEYINVGNYIPGAQKLPLYISLLIFTIVFFGPNGREVLKYNQTKLLILFAFHTGISMTYSIVGSHALRMFVVQAGYIVLYISTYLILKNSKQIRYFIVSFICYHCFLVIVNIDRFNVSNRVGGFKAGYFLGDGNDFSWSLTIFLPFAFYLITISKSKFIKGIMIAASFVLIGGIVAIGSRGAFLAVAAGIVYFALNSRKKLVAIAVAVVLSLCVLAVAPSAYIERIKSIGEYSEDSSALGRITAWKASISMAVDYPFGVGAGNFNSAYGRFYRPSEIDPRIWAGARWISPHSIYFLVLGEYGVIGLITILVLLILNFRENQKQVSALKRLPASCALLDEIAILPKYLNMSLVSFSVGGVFLGGISYPHIFILTALILKTKKINDAR